MTAPGELRIFAAGSLRSAFDVLAGSARVTLEIDYANARNLARQGAWSTG